MFMRETLVFHLEGLDAVGREACEVLMSMDRYRFFFRSGLGLQAEHLDCHLGLVSTALKGMEQLSAECRNTSAWVLFDDGELAPELIERLSHAVILPGQPGIGPVKALVDFAAFLFELTLKTPFEPYGVGWRDWSDVLVEGEYTVACSMAREGDGLLGIDVLANVKISDFVPVQTVQEWAKDCLSVAMSNTTGVGVCKGPDHGMVMSGVVLPMLWGK